MGDSEILEVLGFLIVYGPLVVYLWLALPSPVLGPAVLLGLLWWERRSVRLGKAGSNVKSDDEGVGDIQTEPAADIAGPRVGLSFRHVGVRGVIALLAAPVISVGLLFDPIYGEALMTFASVPCLLLWLRLRRANVIGAEVYGLSAWVVGQSLWLSGLLITTRFETPGSGFDLLGPWFYATGGLFQVAALVYAFASVATALWLMRRGAGQSVGVLLLLGWLVFGVAVWSHTVVGVVHVAFTLGITGYAISREVRRKLDCGMPESGPSVEPVAFSILGSRDRMSAISFALLGVVTLAAFFVVGMWVADIGWLFEENGAGDFGIGWIMYVQVLPVAAASLVAGVIVWKAGRLIRYGAMLIGFMWPLVLSLAVVPHRHLSESGPELVGWIRVPFVAMLTLYVMWRVFGPGAVVDERRAGLVDGARVAGFRGIST